ncbi:hypothetical protein ACEXOS_015090 [Herbiconiux sp. P16]|uniref:hypothetical protein n=1 Tax=Herbiconiux wuyangfengii TaxID=3342794 RepID=UPI0035B94EF9
MSQPVRHFDEIVAFLDAADLTDITVYEERARRIMRSEDDGQVPGPSVAMAVNVSENEVRYRFRMVLADDTSEYVADIETLYVVPEADVVEVTVELQQEFAQRVAYMAAYPFLRASIFGGASRLGTARPVLGLARQDEFEPGEKMTQDEIAATFFDNRSELDSP